MPCNEKVNLDTAKVKLSGKAASTDENSNKTTLSDGFKKMSVSGEEDTKNARSSNSHITERRPKVDSSPMKSSCSGNNPRRGRRSRKGVVGIFARSSRELKDVHIILLRPLSLGKHPS